MRFSLILPIPGPASPEQVLGFAETADELGYYAAHMNSRTTLPVAIYSRHPYMADGRAPWPPDMNWPDTFVVSALVSSPSTQKRS